MSARWGLRGAGRRAVGTLLAVAVLASCGGDDDEAGDATSGTVPTRELAGGDELAIGDTVAASATAEESAGPEPASGGSDPVDLGSVGRDVIVEMNVSMTSDDIARSVSVITARVAALGGGVASSNVDYGDPALDDPGGFAVLVLKVPPASVGDLVSGLGDAGTVRSVGQTAQDVTDQLVDLDIRIENARASVASVREFMEATEDLSELVTLESELARRLVRLERLEAEQRNLSDRVALATVTVEIVPTASVPEPEDDGGIDDAFADGWNAFTSLLYGIAIALAVLTPFLVVLALGGVILWWVVRRRSARSSRALAAPVEAPEHDGPHVPMQ